MSSPLKCQFLNSDVKKLEVKELCYVTVLPEDPVLITGDELKLETKSGAGNIHQYGYQKIL